MEKCHSTSDLHGLLLEIDCELSTIGTQQDTKPTDTRTDTRFGKYRLLRLILKARVSSRFQERLSAAISGIGVMAEFERALIQERVRAGLRNARAKGKRLGRPRRDVDATKIAALHASGTSWRAISRELGVGIATLNRQEA